MLVVDLHTLQPVHILNFLDQIFGKRFNAKNAEDVMWHRATIEKQVTLPNDVAFIDSKWTALWQQIFNRIKIAICWHNPNPALGFIVITKLDPAFAFRDNGKILWTTCLKQFSNARKTTGNVTRL